ncbi:MAG: D-2-hydroxyacid dehydrogenase [Candidatus Binataceae bacterium]
MKTARRACDIAFVPTMKVISTVVLEPALRDALAQAVPGAEIVDRQCRSNDDVVTLAAGGGDVMLGFRVPDDLLERAPGLKWIQLLSAGADHALTGSFKNPRIPITTSSGIHATPIAEYTIGSMLAYAHRLHVAIRAQQRHQWNVRGGFMSSVDELRGKTLGVIGYGSIGRETARLADALGMPVIALKRTPADRRDPGWSPAGLGDPEGKIPRKYFGPDDCETVLRESDYITVTLPLTSATRKFIGAKEIAAMKPEAYIVNIGRGEVIDERALIDALKAGKIGGAGLDVFEHEPLEADSPLWDLENVILTPHISGANRGYMVKACELFAENLRRFAANQPLLNVVDPVHGY